jgi:hypothetical protein
MSQATAILALEMPLSALNMRLDGVLIFKLEEEEKSALLLHQ